MSRRFLHLVALGLLLAGAAARADGLDDPDTEVAKKHFATGRNFYDAQDYRGALGEFLAAKRAKAAPALDYNIARCYDRLEEYALAVEFYQSYVAAKPDAPDAAAVRQRIAALDQRMNEGRPRVPPARLPAGPEKLLPPPSFEDQPPARVEVVVARRPPPDHRRRNLIIIGVTVGVVVVGAAVALGIVFGRSSAPSPTSADYGPWTITR